MFWDQTEKEIINTREGEMVFKKKNGSPSYPSEITYPKTLLMSSFYSCSVWVFTHDETSENPTFKVET